MNTLEFNKGFLATINITYDDFKFIKKEKSIYIFGLKSGDFNSVLPKETAQFAFFYSGRFVFLNIDLIEKLEFTGDFNLEYLNDKSESFKKGYKCACHVFADLVEQEYF